MHYMSDVTASFMNEAYAKQYDIMLKNIYASRKIIQIINSSSTNFSSYKEAQKTCLCRHSGKRHFR